MSLVFVSSSSSSDRRRMRKRTTRGGRKKRGGKPITFHADIKSHGGSQLFLGYLKFANWCYVRKPLSMSSSKELSFLCTFTDTFTKVPVFIEMTFHPLLLAAMKVMIQLNMANMCLKIACAERSTLPSLPDLGEGYHSKHAVNARSWWRLRS